MWPLVRRVVGIVLLLITWPVLVAFYVLGWVTSPTHNSVRAGARVAHVLSRCPSREQYHPFPLLSLPLLRSHLQTIVADVARQVPALPYDLRTTLPVGGGTLGLHYYLGGRSASSPLVVLFPGLTGTARDSYVLSMVAALKRIGARVLVVPGRGNDDSKLGAPPRDHLYNARATGDQHAVLQHARREFPAAPLFAIGFSLGANVLTNCLADHPGLVDGAMAISSPWDLARSSASVLQRSWLYSFAFGRALTAYATRNWDALRSLYTVRLLKGTELSHSHQARTGETEAPLRDILLRRSVSVLEFDAAVTCKVAGYPSPEAYYRDASSHTRVAQIDVPFLALSALDDPCVESRGMPLDAGSEHCAFVLTHCGGHLGFLQRGWQWRSTSYADQLACEWITALLEEKAQ